MTRLWLTGAILAGAMAPLAAEPATQGKAPDYRVAQVVVPDRGLEIARQVCAECHAIEPGRTRSPNAEAPAFQVIADTPGMSPLALRAFLYTPHRMMPNIVLTREEADAIIDYIRSLASK